MTTCIQDGVEAGAKHLWLGRTQQRDGSWGCEHSTDATVAVTSLALLTMLGDGSTLRSGPLKQQIKNAVSWLRSRQVDSDAFAKITGPHLLASLAMTETYLLSDYKLLKKSVSNGLQYANSMRTADGGWRASATEELSDPSLTVWGTTLLATAIDAGEAPANPKFRTILDWLNGPRATVISERGMLGAAAPVVRQAELAYDQSAANAFTLCWLAVNDPDAATSKTLQAKAQKMREAALLRAKALPRKWQPDPKHKLSMHEWFCSSYALQQASDADAVQLICKALAAEQVADGEHQGSWHPIGVWGEVGDRTWTTAMAVLTLEVPYRYGKIVGR